MIYYPRPGHDPWFQTYYDDWRRAQAWGSMDPWCGAYGGGYLGAALTDVQDAAISGYLSQLYLFPVASQVVPGALAFVAVPLAQCQAAPPAGGCTKNALDSLRDFVTQNPQTKVYANPQSATPTRVDLVVSADAATQNVLSAPGSAFGEVTIGPPREGPPPPAIAKRPKGTTGGLLVGALIGGGLGAVAAGGIGGVAGAVAGAFVGNAVTKA